MYQEPKKSKINCNQNKIYLLQITNKRNPFNSENIFKIKLTFSINKTDFTYNKFFKASQEFNETCSNYIFNINDFEIYKNTKNEIGSYRKLLSKNINKNTIELNTDNFLTLNQNNTFTFIEYITENNCTKGCIEDLKILKSKNKLEQDYDTSILFNLICTLNNFWD